MKYAVGYLRVSTREQGRSGLGLESPRRGSHPRPALLTEAFNPAARYSGVYDGRS
jgi:hypothetical protein